MLVCECASRRDGFMHDVMSRLWVHAGCGRPRRQYLERVAPHLL